MIEGKEIWVEIKLKKAWRVVTMKCTWPPIKVINKREKNRVVELE